MQRKLLMEYIEDLEASLYEELLAKLIILSTIKQL
jgi:hypothetical protein